MSTAARVVSVSWDFDDSVLASRFSSEPPSGRRRAVEGLAHLGDVAAQAIDLFVHVLTLRKHRQFVFQPIMIHLGDQRCDAFQQSGARPGMHLRKPRPHPGRQFQEPHAALFERLAQPSAFTVAKARKLGQCVVQQLVRRGHQGRNLAGIIAHHTRPAQQFHHVDACGGAGLRRSLLGAQRQRTEQFCIDFE